jgi:glycogen debranching enzyme
VTSVWEFGGQPVTSGKADGDETLLDGTTFCISASNGDIDRGGVHGLFVRDTRFCSRFVVRIDGQTTQAVSTISSEPFARTFLSRVRPTVQHPDPSIVLCRHRYVGDGMHEVLELKNLHDAPATIDLAIDVAADFAHIFEVKDDHVRPRGFHSVEATEHAVLFEFRDRALRRRLSVSVPHGAQSGPGIVTISPTIPGRSSWTCSLLFQVELDGRAIEPRTRSGAPASWFDPAARSQSHPSNPPKIQLSDEAFSIGVRRAEEDLRALRIVDPDHPEETIVAAGAPWYMALFGRDSLLTSWMALPVEPALAEGTLRALARQQATALVPEADEEPGKILHELRFRLEGPANGAAASAYYGSVDSTPLFVMLLGEARRWGLSPEIVDELIPHADRSIEWIEQYGDRDGDGFVEYARLTDDGFPNQGWKDSPDGVTFADGTVATAPIALCEVQGYVYAAYAARYTLAVERGEHEVAARCAERARSLRSAFNETFWVSEGEYFALGLDRDKRRIDSLTSNIGHLLWTGIVDDDKAAAIARHLVGDDLFSGWGIRTLAASMAAYNPMSYHNGSVWPHDSAIAVAGLMRYGFVDEAHQVLRGMLDALNSFHGRFPELFSGFSRQEFAEPVAYPTACAPQAWASGALFLMLRTILRLDPSVGARAISLAPALPPTVDRVSIDRVRLDGEVIAIAIEHGAVTISGLAEDVTVRTDPAGVHWELPT